MRVSVVIALAALALGCGSVTEPTKGSEKVYAAVDGALIVKTWPARMADDAIRARFEGGDGWRAIFESDLQGAIAAFSGGSDPRGLARAHQGIADLYRQAALLSAHATVEAYGVDGLETDPLELSYVIGVGHAIRGERDAALERFSSVDAKGPFGAKASAWKTALSSEGEMPDLQTLSSISGDLGEVTPGTDPAFSSEPDALLPERTEQAKEMAVMDPTRLLTRSAWHAAAASMSAPPTDSGVLAQVASRYAVGSPDPNTHVELPVDDAWLFCSNDLMAADVGFIAEASVKGVAAVTSWADKSVLAAAVQPAIVDGKVVPDAVLDAGFALQKQLQATMADIGGGEQAFHRPFALRSRVAVLLAGMVVADANDQYRDAGILRLNALERMEQTGLDPVFALSVAAWDAGNRNPLRPEEITHQLKTSYPALFATRAPLEALHLRRSRNAGPSNPVH